MNHSAARTVNNAPSVAQLAASAISAVIAKIAITGLYVTALGSATGLPRYSRRSS